MRTAGDFSLNDLPGAGRIDVACRCVTSSLLLSHGVRRNVSLYIHMLGEPDPPKTLLFKGDEIKYLSPDERSAGSLIKKALSMKVSRGWINSTPGVMVSRICMDELLDELSARGQLFLLREDGEDIRNIEFKGEVSFVLGDHMGLTNSQEELVRTKGAKAISVGPLSLHADQCIVIVLNEIDRTSENKFC